jgi:hypothetical protein
MVARRMPWKTPENPEHIFAQAGRAFQIGATRTPAEEF